MNLSLGKCLAMLATAAIAAAPALLAGGGHDTINGAEVPVWMVVPFIGVLLSIAIFPLVKPHFWEHHFGKIAAFWGVIGVGLLFVKFSPAAIIHDLAHTMLLDYVPFLILLLGLFTIAGGIRITGQLRGSPRLNTAMLLIGWVLASFMGTTGASMLMIRPLLRANEWRKNKAHLVVFFIFLVSNMGGALTPLGDPPLFLGFLRGVEFQWTLLHLWQPTLIASVILFAVFFVLDKWMLSREEQKEPPVVAGPVMDSAASVRLRRTRTIPKTDAPLVEVSHKFGIEGGVNFALLAVLIGAILLSSYLGNNQFYDKETAAQFGIYSEKPVMDGKSAKLDANNRPMTVVEEARGALGHAGLRQRALKEALDLSATKPADAALKYDEAISESALTDKEMHELEHDAGHAGDKAHEPANESHAEDPFVIKAEVPADVKAWAEGGLVKRREALAAAGDKGDALKPLVLRDYMKAVSLKTQVQEMQAAAATKAVAIPGPFPGIPYTNLVRDAIILLLVFVSLRLTSKTTREGNGFSWGPIKEVAKLFAAIFICMVPALKILSAGLDGGLAPIIAAVSDANGNPIEWRYFWFAGTLSSFLDNAPTYLVFFNTAGGDPKYLMSEFGGHLTLAAISMGAVFMGANTYIGNAPNFMVKAIAESSGVKMPSFFGYMLWSVTILVPVFVLITLLEFIWKLV